ncbi:hypothetical protein GCM10028801_33380 [Nocardioides maradonensis]
MPVRRTSVAVAAIAAAGLVPALGQSAIASGHGHAAGQTRQLHHQVSGLDRRLARVEASHALAALADDTEQAVDANIENDRAILATLDDSVDAMTPADAKAARRQLRAFHVDNYVRVVAILRRAEGLVAGAATVPAAQAALDQAVATALGITASSPRSATRDARDSLDEADQDIDDDSSTDGTDDSTDGTGTSDDGSGDDTTP